MRLPSDRLFPGAPSNTDAGAVALELARATCCQSQVSASRGSIVRRSRVMSAIRSRSSRCVLWKHRLPRRRRARLTCPKIRYMDSVRSSGTLGCCETDSRRSPSRAPAGATRGMISCGAQPAASPPPHMVERPATTTGRAKCARGTRSGQDAIRRWTGSASRDRRPQR